MKNVCGPPVQGDDFRFRDADVAEILNLLEVGHSVLLIGLRRIGKTSVMMGVQAQAPASWIVSRHNVQDMRLPSDFFGVLLKSLPKGAFDQLMTGWLKAKTIPNRVLNAIKSHISKLGGGGAAAEFQTAVIDYWEPLSQGIEQVLADIKTPFVLILDEFPVFVEHMLVGHTPPVMVESMLGQLKAWREQYPHFRLLIGGSISLDRILAKHRILASTIGDLTRYFLPPLSHDQANAFLQELADAYTLGWYDEARIETSLDLIEDYYPYFLQAFFMQVRLRANPQEPNLQLVFDNHFMPSIRKPFFDQFLDRLRTHYPRPEQQAARRIFDLIARDEAGRANYSKIRSVVDDLDFDDPVDLDEVLYDLAGDDFLRLDSRTNEYYFATKLIARWWTTTRGRP